MLESGEEEGGSHDAPPLERIDRFVNLRIEARERLAKLNVRMVVARALNLTSDEGAALAEEVEMVRQMVEKLAKIGLTVDD